MPKFTTQQEMKEPNLLAEENRTVTNQQCLEVEMIFQM